MLRRIAVLLVLLLAGATALGRAAAFAADRADGADANRRDPVTLARQRLDSARAEATDLAARISAAQTEQAKLEADIADAEAKIPAMRARATELRIRVKARAAQLYVQHGSSDGFESTMAAESAEDGLRAAHLTATIGDQDLAAATELRDTAAKLAAQEVQQRQRRADLLNTLGDLAPLNDLLQQKLQIASALYDKVHALVVEGAAKQGSDVSTGATACPVAGVVVFTDDFGELRVGGPHPGIDMAAVADTPVVAVSDGVWRRDVGGDGGNGAWLVGSDGTSYYYAHLSRYEGTAEGGLVKAGTVIGYVGMTGNATGPHLHFEIHPGAPGIAPPVDPFATLLALCTDDIPDARAS